MAQVSQTSKMGSLPKMVAVIGPTGSGKTELGVFLAQRFKGEIVSADAKQVYQGMDIGTAKERKLPLPQHLINIKKPGEKVTVGEYQRLAYQVIDRLLAEGKVPFLVGGSGLYAESVIEGYLFGGPRSRRRLPRYTTLKLGIAVPREELKARLRVRTTSWLEQGLLNEISQLLAAGVDPDWLFQCGQEYRYFTLHLLGKLTLEEAREKTNQSLDQFVKRQYTWWRRHSDIHWIQSQEEAVEITGDFLQAGN